MLAVLLSLALLRVASDRPVVSPHPVSAAAPDRPTVPVIAPSPKPVSRPTVRDCLEDDSTETLTSRRKAEASVERPATAPSLQALLGEAATASGKATRPLFYVFCTLLI